MARPAGNLGTNQDLDLGSTGYARSYVTWVGGNTSAVDNAFYYTGNLVVHNDEIYIALMDNENVEPGLTASATTWRSLGSTTSASTTPPSGPMIGALWLNSTTCKTYRWNGFVWVQISGLEILALSRVFDGGGLFSAVLQDYDGGDNLTDNVETELDGGMIP